MIFSENFLSVEVFLEWKWVFILLTYCLPSQFLQYQCQRVFSPNLHVNFHLYCPIVLCAASLLSQARPRCPGVSLWRGVVPLLVARGMSVWSVSVRQAADSDYLPTVSSVGIMWGWRCSEFVSGRPELAGWSCLSRIDRWRKATCHQPSLGHHARLHCLGRLGVSKENNEKYILLHA